MPEGIAGPCDVSSSTALPPAASQRSDALNARLQHLYQRHTEQQIYLSLCSCVFVFTHTPSSLGVFRSRTPDRITPNINLTFSPYRIFFTPSSAFILAPPAVHSPRLIPALCLSVCDFCFFVLFIVPCRCVAEERHHPSPLDMSALFYPVAAE